MTYKISFKTVAFLITALVMQTISYAQKKNFIGLNLTGEQTSLKYFVTGFGGTFEHQFNKHMGFETGVYYRKFVENGKIYVDGALFASYKYKERYLSIPLLYKYTSNVLNFSAGPTMDLFIGRSKIKGAFGNLITNSRHNTLNLGLMAKLGKTIAITDRLLLEPEFRFNTIHYKYHDKRSNFALENYYGLGISGKYRLGK